MMRIAGPLVVGLFILFADPASASQYDADQIHRYALIVGTNRAPSNDLSQLEFADDDAALSYTLLEPAMKETALLTVMDGPTQQRFPWLVSETHAPSRKAFVEALKNMFALIEDSNREGFETELYFVYSGHGRLTSTGETAIAIQDGELTRSELYEHLISKSPASFNHLIIDACNAYYLLNKRGGEEWANDKTGMQRKEVTDFFDLQDLQHHPNTGVILSSTSAAETHEWKVLGAGVFSHEVRSAFAGAADISGDGLVEYSEVEAFIRAANHKVASQEAKMAVFVRAPSIDQSRPIFDLKALKETSLLTIPKDVEGRFSIEASTFGRYVDFNKSPEQPVTIALITTGEEERTYIVRNHSAEMEYSVETSSGKNWRLDSLQGLPAKDTSKGFVDASYRKELFAQPFGRGYYFGVVQVLSSVPARENYRPEWSPADENPPPPPIKWRLPVGWISLGISIGSFAAAGYFIYLANDRWDKFEKDIRHDDANKAEARGFTVGAVGSMTLAVATASLAIYSFATLEKERTLPNSSASLLKKASWNPVLYANDNGAVFGLVSTF